jgi:hypothetical protein
MSLQEESHPRICERENDPFLFQMKCHNLKLMYLTVYIKSMLTHLIKV